MTRAIIALLGALGVAFVWRASELYKGTDVLAHRMVLLIGAGLLVGIGELLFRATRTARLEAALAGLPKKPAREDVEKLDEPLRSFVEARLNGTPQSLGTAMFTTYLLGLLVMMGLFGTFMGLFETLSGAREALGASGDVTALREGLSAPMKGLSRAFGTSATGVASSALLGLAAVFLRRSEARFTAAVTALASGPLFAWTIAGRQLVALEALAENRDALPLAAKALEDAAASVQKDVERGVARATDALAPLLEGAVTRTAEGAAKVVETWTRRIEEDAASRSAKDDARRAEFEAASQAMLDRITAAFDALSTRVDERESKRANALDEIAARVDLQSEHATQRLTEHAERVAALAAAEDARVRTRATEEDARTRARTETEDLRARERAEQEDARVRERAAQEDARIRERAEREDARAHERAEREDLLVRARAEQEAERARVRDELAEARFLERAQKEDARALERAEKEDARLRERAETEDARAEAIRVAEDARSRARAEADAVRDVRLAELAEKLERIASSIDARTDVVVNAVETQLVSSVQRAASSLEPLLDRAVERAAAAATQQVDRFTERLESEAALRSEEAATRVRVLEASARESLGTVSRELATVPEAVRTFLVAEEKRVQDRDHGDAAREARLDTLLTRIDELASALEQRSHDQDERAIELEAKLDKERAEAASLLVEKLSHHAASLGEGLGKTAALVQEAAASVRTGGTELSAVAEMFTGAVDRYRDANERWLDTLPSLEGALEKKGGTGDAVDLLGAYLDQTREVFDHSLAFQRELFAELRALRAAPVARPAAPRTIPPVRQTDGDKDTQ